MDQKIFQSTTTFVVFHKLKRFIQMTKCTTFDCSIIQDVRHHKNLSDLYINKAGGRSVFEKLTFFSSKCAHQPNNKSQKPCEAGKDSN